MLICYYGIVLLDDLHQEFEGQLGRRQCRRSPHRPDSRSHLPMRQGLHVLGNVLLDTQHRSYPVARVVDPAIGLLIDLYCWLRREMVAG